MVLGCPGKVELCDEKSRVLRSLRNMVDNLEMSMCRAQSCCGPCPPPYCPPPLCQPQPCCPAPPCCASAPCCAPQPCCAPPVCMQPPYCLPPAPSCPEVMCSPRGRGGGGCPPVCPCPPPGCCTPRCGTPRCCKPRCCKPRERPPDIPILPLPPLPSVLQCCCKTCDGRPAGMGGHAINPNLFQLKRTKSYELRSSIMYKGCECEKRYGLQDDCPRTGCHGSPECLTKPPTCGPSEYCDGKHLAKKFRKKKKITYVCPACCRPG